MAESDEVVLLEASEVVHQEKLYFALETPGALVDLSAGDTNCNSG